MIDAHCHLNTSYSLETVAPILNSFTAAGGTQIVDVTTTLDDISLSQTLIASFPNMLYSTIGIHPESSNGNAEDHMRLMADIQTLETRIPSLQNIVGIGETGLDYSHKLEYPDNFSIVIEQQRELFVTQLEVANKHGFPLVIHARGEHVLDYQAYKDILTIIKSENFPNTVYFHSFGGDYDLAKKIVDDGNVLGVNGIVTYSNAKEISNVVTQIPLEFLLLETDAPYLIPSNMDRKLLASAKTNEPQSIFFTAKRIAALKNIPVEQVLSETSQTTKRIFAKML